MTDGGDGTITLSFPGLSPAEAAALARELTSEFVAAGAELDELRVARTDKEAMDLGGVLVVLGSYLGSLAWTFAEEFVKGTGREVGREVGKIAGRKLREIIERFGQRKGTAVAIEEKTSGERVTIGTPRQAPIFRDGARGLEKLAVVLIGASRYPHNAELDNPSFRRSAEAVKALFSGGKSGFADTALLDLFDEPVGPSEVIQRVDDHLEAHADASDLLIYYCGHGSFLKDQSYVLTLAGTRKQREATTGLNLDAFRNDLETRLMDKRVYLIFDCCFSGAAVSAFQLSSLDNLVEKRVVEWLPPRGWAVLTASSRDDVAMAPRGQNLTMFTDALVSVLGQGMAGRAERLSMRDVAEQAWRHIRNTHGAAAVRPECHAPRQGDGDVSGIPVFRNAAFGGRPASETARVAVPPVAVPPPSFWTFGAPVVTYGLPSEPARPAPQPPRPAPPPPAPAPPELRLIRPAAKPGDPAKPGTIFRDAIPGLAPDVAPEMVIIPPGRFLMGSPASEAERHGNEGPQHEVTIGRAFALGRHPVTVAEFTAFVQASRHDMGDSEWRSPGFAQGDHHPVTCVSWRDARAYCAWLSGKTGKAYRLPSEAEWEYACRAGTVTPFFFGETISTEQANYDGNYTYGAGKKGKYVQGTTPVGTYRGNTFGLGDMHGNVWEWCEDTYRDSYAGAPVDGSAVTAPAKENIPRVLRGGSWDVFPRLLRSAQRIRVDPGGRIDDGGFRVARTLLTS